MTAHRDPRIQDPRYQDPYALPQGRPPQRPRERSAMGSFVFYGLLGLVAMAAGAAAFAVVALPANFVRDRVIAAVKERTGRDLVIAGSSFTFYPSLGVSLADVSLSPAPGFGGDKPLVAMKSLDVSVAFWPLIKREVQISTMVLREPVFNLEIDTGGRRSWEFAAADDRAGRLRFAQAESGVKSDAGGAVERPSRTRLAGLKLEDVRIDDGALTYSDQRTGKASEFSAINVKMELAALEETLQAQGSLAWKGKTVSFSSALTSLADIMESRPAKVKVTFGADVLDATFDGSARLADSVSAEGILSAKSASARDLAHWFGSDLPPSAGFGNFTAKGLLRTAPERMTLSTAEIVLDQTTARGEIGLDTSGARPLVNANLKLTELDLDTYASHGEGTAGRAPLPAAPGGGGGKAQSIEDLLQETVPPGPRVKGYTKRDGWSEEPFNLEMLGLVDANAKLSIGKLTVRDIHLDQSDVTVALKNRVMKTTLDQVRLYEGTGRGTITVDGTAGSSASLTANLALDAISAKPLLTDAADIDRVTGKGRLALALAGQGASERQLVETLNGKFEAAFADGAIIGINVAEMMRNLSKGNLGGLETAPTDKTDFSEMTSTWTVKSGIAENQDLKLVSPMLRLTGSGRVILPTRELDYTLRPKIVASIAGQGDTQDLSGIEVPVRMHGAWADPKFSPDLGAALKNPKTVETIKEIGKQFKGKKADEIVDDLFGSKSGDGESGKSKGKKLLEQFLNQ